MFRFIFLIISENRFFVYHETQAEFIGYKTVSDALEFLDSPIHHVYAFSEKHRTWEPIHFATEGLSSKKSAMGFVPT